MFTMATDQIRLEGPLKEFGLYTIKFRLSSEVEGELKVWVVPSVGADQDSLGRQLREKLGIRGLAYGEQRARTRRVRSLRRTSDTRLARTRRY